MRGRLRPGGRSWLLTIALTLLLGAWPHVPRALEPPLPGFAVTPYLTNPAADGVTVCWEPLAEMSGRVEWGTTSGYGDSSADESVSGVHRVRLRGLSPSTTYHYQVVSGAERTPDRTFRTAPDGSGAVRVAVYGDSRSYSAVHNRVVALLMGRAPDLVIHTGDLVSDGSQRDTWRTQHFTVPNLPAMATVPWVPAWGNHDGPHPPDGSSYLWHYFPPPWNDPLEPRGRYFNLPCGPLEFFVLDCGVPLSAGSPQRAWLERALGESKAELKIPVVHFPAYSSADHPGAPEVQELDGLWRRYQVQLVLSGHSHVYERSQRGGTTYVVTGGGGAELHRIDVTPNPYMLVAKAVHHYCMIDFEGGILTLTAYDTDDNPIDSITLTADRFYQPGPEESSSGSGGACFLAALPLL